MSRGLEIFIEKNVRHNPHYEKIEDEPFEIPENWAWAKLPDVCRAPITDGTHNSPPNTNEGEFFYITAKNIKDDGVDLSNVSYVSKEIHNSIVSRCCPEKGDVLLTKDGTIGNATVNNLNQPFSLLSSVALIKTHRKVLPWYIVFCLRSSYLQKSMKNDAKGTALKRVILSQINDFVIPLPPLAEQSRIVAKIEELFAELDLVLQNV